MTLSDTANTIAVVNVMIDQGKGNTFLTLNEQDKCCISWEQLLIFHMSYEDFNFGEW